MPGTFRPHCRLQGGAPARDSDTAGPVILPTTRGDWSFETFYDGNDNYIFLNTTANGSDFSNFVTTLWESNFKFFLWEASEYPSVLHELRCFE